MKKNLIFIISLFLLSCTSEKELPKIEICPEVFFSKEHRIYLRSEEEQLRLDNISYQAKINNYYFDSSCQTINNTLSSVLSFLIIVQPEKAKQDNIEIPYYIAVMNNKDKIIDIQYYNASGNFNKNIDGSYIETEIIDIINISIPYSDHETRLKYKLLVGFMLDKEKLKIIN